VKPASTEVIVRSGPQGRERDCRVEDQAQDVPTLHLKAGDVFVIESGMKGTWEVVETVRKYFVFA
jgi:uncharacterized cupin superfamily protein